MLAPQNQLHLVAQSDLPQPWHNMADTQSIPALKSLWNHEPKPMQDLEEEIYGDLEYSYEYGPAAFPSHNQPPVNSVPQLWMKNHITPSKSLDQGLDQSSQYPSLASQNPLADHNEGYALKQHHLKPSEKQAIHERSVFQPLM